MTDQPQAIRELSATSFTHEEPLTAPVSFVVQEVDREETVHLLLMLPDGTGLDAAGRIGDVQTRERIDMQRQIEEQKKRLEELQRQLEEAQDRNGVERTIGGLFGSDGGTGAMSANSVIRMESARCKTCKVFLTR